MAARMSLAWSRVGLGDGFVQCSQEARVTLIAFVGPVRASLFLHKSCLGLQGEATEFVRLQLVQFSFNFGETHALSG